MSPVNQITNPGYNTEIATAGQTTAVFMATGAITKGMLVQLVTGYPGTGSIKVTKSATAENSYILGVAANTAASGGLVTVITNGLAFVLVSAAVTKGQFLVQSTTAAGKGVSAATAAVGKTVGVVLTSGTGSQYAWIERM